MYAYENIHFGNIENLWKLSPIYILPEILVQSSNDIPIPAILHSLHFNLICKRTDLLK